MLSSKTEAETEVIHSPVLIPDGDYVLTEGAAWLDTKGFAIRVHSTDEGIIVDIYDAEVAKTGDFDAALITSTFAYNHELGVDESV